MKQCKICHKKIIKKSVWSYKTFNTIIYCSRKCFHKGQIGRKRSFETREKMSNAHKREKSSLWKGGLIRKNGYVYILQPHHPFCTNNGYVKRSRLIMEKHLKRFLKPEETIHHINNIRNDDRFENFKLFKNRGEHSIFHNRRNPNS